MGLNRDFSLNVLGNNFNKSNIEIIDELRNQYENAEHAIDKFGGVNSCSNWYEYESDMRKFSMLYPTNIFELTINNMVEDAIIVYFKNGKMQICEAVVTFEPFDENKLR